jgi:hypothetical protein
VLQSFPAGATAENIVGFLKGPYRDQQLAAAYRLQLKARNRLSNESLQVFAAAVEQMAHRTYVGLCVDFIQREAAHAFVDGVRENWRSTSLRAATGRSTRPSTWSEGGSGSRTTNSAGSEKDPDWNAAGSSREPQGRTAGMPTV